MSAFRLSGLLRLRRMEEDQAAAELARTTIRRQRATRRAEEALAQLSGHDLTPYGGDPTAFRAAIAARASLSAIVFDTQAAAESAREQEQQASDRWSQARTQSKSLDKLEQRHVLAEVAEQGRTEQHALDELATQRATATGERGGAGAERTSR